MWGVRSVDRRLSFPPCLVLAWGDPWKRFSGRKRFDVSPVETFLRGKRFDVSAFDAPTTARNVSTGPLSRGRFDGSATRKRFHGSAFPDPWKRFAVPQPQTGPVETFRIRRNVGRNRATFRRVGYAVFKKRFDVSTIAQNVSTVKRVSTCRLSQNVSTGTKTGPVETFRGTRPVETFS